MSNAILASSQYQNYRKIDLIVVHCSATRCNRPFALEAVIACHKARGFATIGYHYYVTRDGVVHAGRPLYQEGAHATGFNRRSIGVCYEGGLSPEGKPMDTRTLLQKETLRKLLSRLKTDYPEAVILGHRDLPGVRKECPCFDAAVEYHWIGSQYQREM
jgi:N-acetyl-anhydromuramyl-L-alanine amidase AmpD